MTPLSNDQLKRLQKEHPLVNNELLEGLSKSEAHEIIQEAVRLRNAAESPLERQRAMNRLSEKIRNMYGERSCKMCGKATGTINSESSCSC